MADIPNQTDKSESASHDTAAEWAQHVHPDTFDAGRRSWSAVSCRLSMGAAASRLLPFD
jgi:hypothetical protein